MASNTPIDAELIVEDPRWTTALPDAEALMRAALDASFAKAGFNEAVALSVLLTNNEQVQTLNRAYRGQDKPTNVLSFPSESGPEIPGLPRTLGDIALAYETMVHEAEIAGRALAEHFLHLIVHASLHLIGYTHEAEQDAERMEALEIAVLAGLGVANPYIGSGAAQAVYGTREQ